MSSSTEGSVSSDQAVGQKSGSTVLAVFRLVLACLGFAVVLAGPAWWLAGAYGLIGLSAAAVLCSLPGVLAICFRRLVGGSQASLILAAGGLRMGFVLLGALVARFGIDGYGLSEFFIWLILFYLFTLFLETISVLKDSKSIAER